MNSFYNIFQHFVTVLLIVWGVQQASNPPSCQLLRRKPVYPDRYTLMYQSSHCELEEHTQKHKRSRKYGLIKARLTISCHYWNINKILYFIIKELWLIWQCEGSLKTEGYPAWLERRLQLLSLKWSWIGGKRQIWCQRERCWLNYRRSWTMSHTHFMMCWSGIGVLSVRDLSHLNASLNATGNHSCLWPSNCTTPPSEWLLDLFTSSYYWSFFCSSRALFTIYFLLHLYLFYFKVLTSSLLYCILFSIMSHLFIYLFIYMLTRSNCDKTISPWE